MGYSRWDPYFMGRGPRKLTAQKAWVVDVVQWDNSTH